MPKPPLPPELVQFLQAPRPAIVGTVRPDGGPVTTATWYGWERDLLLLSMRAGGLRARRLENDPRLALTVLGDSWNDHVSLRGRVVTLRHDEELADIDRLSQRYWGKPFPDRDARFLTALVEIMGWHTFGNPGAHGFA